MNIQRKATYLIERATRKHIKLGGVLPSENEPPKVIRKNTYSQKKSPLPMVVDLRWFLKPVEDHSIINICVSDAVTVAYEYLQNRISGKLKPLSSSFLYYNARMIEGNEDHDIGSSISSNLEFIVTKGICTEETWSYDPDMVAQKPHYAAYKEARKKYS